MGSERVTRVDERWRAGVRADYPVVAALEPVARRRLPGFVYDYLQGGTGEEHSRTRNLDAFRAVEIVSRYGVDVSGVDTSATLFGKRYAAPLVIAPIGMDGAIRPGAARHLAGAARDAGIACVTGSLSATPVEETARAADGNLWFQLYGMADGDHRVSFDLMRRARAAGIDVLAVTVDIPAPARRVRDMRNRLQLPFRLTPRLVARSLDAPGWLMAMAREGRPHFANMKPYCDDGASRSQIDRFVAQARPGAGVTWDTLARFRDAWPGAMILKGVQHPADARRAARTGFDGLVVSNHGGRQFDASPATIDLTPAIREAVGASMTVLMDGGVMSGLDILKALACGADGVLAGRAFMLGLAALGPRGARFVADTLVDEFRVALAQSGACAASGARDLTIRHRNAWRADDFN